MMTPGSDTQSYLWKCWRDTRALFLATLGVVLAAGVFHLYAAFDPFGWIAAGSVDTRAMWQFTAQAFFGTTLGLIPASGLLLGARGVGTEFERGTAELLLTRPQRRYWFLWMSWGCGAAQMAALVLAGNLFRLAPMGAERQRITGFEHFFVSAAALCTLGLLYFSLTYLMTTLSRSSRNGTGLAVGTLAAYFTAVVVLRNFYGIEVPIRLLEDLFRLAFQSADSPATVLAGLGACAAMTLCAQFYFQRAEV